MAERCSAERRQGIGRLGGFSVLTSIQSSGVDTALPCTPLTGSDEAAKFGAVKFMLIFLLGVRLLFLSAAGAMCIYGLSHAADAKMEWYWTVGHIAVLAVSVFLIGRVWATLKATWKE